MLTNYARRYHGLADGLIPSGMSEYLYRAVLRTLKPRGIELDDFYRLFLIPGMQHCAGTSDKVNAPWYVASHTGSAPSLMANSTSRQVLRWS